MDTLRREFNDVYDKSSEATSTYKSRKRPARSGQAHSQDAYRLITMVKDGTVRGWSGGGLQVQLSRLAGGGDDRGRTFWGCCSCTAAPVAAPVTAGLPLPGFQSGSFIMAPTSSLSTTARCKENKASCIK